MIPRIGAARTMAPSWEFTHTVVADVSGSAEFPCPDGSVSVWLQE